MRVGAEERQSQEWRLLPRLKQAAGIDGTTRQRDQKRSVTHTPALVSDRSLLDWQLCGNPPRESGIKGWLKGKLHLNSTDSKAPGHLVLYGSLSFDMVDLATGEPCSPPVPEPAGSMPSV